jgi:O-acetyl-ADP-ribose deacetylase (regulator of RNase III)
MKVRAGSAVLELVEGDITDLEVDAIVNPANRALKLGGGVAGAIARRGGPAVQEECDRIGGTPGGTAVITTGGSLPARHVIHAVGPMWGEGGEEKKLAEATRSALRVADGNGLRSLALPAISTGIFGYPLEEAARVILGCIRDHLATHDSPLERVVVCLFDQTALRVFETELREQIQGGEGA